MKKRLRRFLLLFANNVSTGVKLLITWLLSFNTDGTATVPTNGSGDVVNGNTSSTWARTWDATSGLVLSEYPAGSYPVEGLRQSYDTNEGATLGSELVDTFNDATSWTVYGTNTIENDNGELKITYVDNQFGAYARFGIAGGLSEDVVVGLTYVVTGTARVNTGSVTLETNVVGGDTQAITSSTGENFSLVLVPDSPSANTLRCFGMSTGEIIWLSNISVKQIYPASINTVSSVDSTPLHPTATKQDADGNDYTVYLEYDYWTAADATVTTGDRRFVKGTDAHNYALTATNSATTGGSISVATADIGSTVSDGGVTWSVDSYYSNIANATTNHLPAVMNEPAATNYLLQSGTPATQTTGSLATGTYTAWVDDDATGSFTVTDNTATSDAAGQTVSAGSPLTFTVSGSGTVDIAVTGSITYFQLENSAVRTSPIPTTTSTVTRAATSYKSATDLGDFIRFRITPNDLTSAQVWLSNGTSKIGFDGTNVYATDGTNTATAVQALSYGAEIGWDNTTGKLYFNNTLIETDATVVLDWTGDVYIGSDTSGSVMNGGMTDIMASSADLTLTDGSWSQP